MLTVLAAGPLATVQDRGRAGYAAIGVPRSGAADAGAAGLANRLVGNDDSAAVLEATAGGLRLRAERTVLVAVTGAPAPLSPGARLPVGHLRAEEPFVDVAGVAAPSSAPVLRVLPGPRRDWLDPGAWTALTRQGWTVTADSNRVGLRLAGPELARARTDELPSEGLVAGAVQVPPDGAPVLFLADHPVTGGYPVLAVVTTADLGAAAQLRPGDSLRFRPVR